jgi:hypothetical protein
MVGYLHYCLIKSISQRKETKGLVILVTHFRAACVGASIS